MTMRAMTMLVVLGGIMAGLSSTLYAQEMNLHVSRDATVKIQTLDREFLRDFDVYVADSISYPTAILFDRRDTYTIADRYWGTPLTVDRIEEAILGAQFQYESGNWDFVRSPQAINIVNTHGALLGYVYTSLAGVLMRRSPDGAVRVYKPNYISPRDRAGN